MRTFADEGPPMAAVLRLAVREPETSTYARRLLAAIASPAGAGRQRPAPDRTAQRTRARGLAPAGQRPRRPGHRARAHRLAADRPHAHPEHLREARREQSPCRRPPCDGARSARGQRGATPHRVVAEKSSAHSSRVLMRAHHLSLHGVPSEPGRRCRPALQLATRTRSGMTEQRHPTPDLPGAVRYEIRLTGRLDAHWAAWFDGMTISQASDGTHRHQRPDRRPGRPPRRAPARARPRSAAGVRQARRSPRPMTTGPEAGSIPTTKGLPT